MKCEWEQTTVVKLRSAVCGQKTEKSKNSMEDSDRKGRGNLEGGGDLSIYPSRAQQWVEDVTGTKLWMTWLSYLESSIGAGITAYNPTQTQDIEISDRVCFNG